MEQIELRASSREVLGKKVRFLRREGTTPVHLFGHGVESLALQCDTAQLQYALAQAGRAKLVGLKLDKGKKPRSVVVREIQKDPRTGELLHVDFYQVSMVEKMKVQIPINLVGEAPALRFKGNTLMRELSNLTVECLPDDIPPTVDVDLSSLTEAGQSITVKDIVLGEAVAILEDPEHIVVKISVLTVEKIEEEVEEAEEAEAEEGEEVVVEASETTPLPEQKATEE